MRSTRSLAVWLIMGLLIVGLMGFGTANFSGSSRQLASVGDRDVSLQEYANALSNQMRAVEAQTGQRPALADLQSSGIDRQILSQLISSRALENEAARLGVSAGDDRVAEAITGNPAFVGPTGTFDRAAYREILSRSQLSEGDYEDNLRNDFARAILQEAVTGSIAAPAGIADLLIAHSLSSRDVTWAKVPASLISPAITAPDEAALTTYYEANQNQFIAPEQRNVTIAALTPDMLIDEVALDEASLRALYEERADTYQQPERRLVERLAFATEQDAQTASDRLSAGEVSFDELVSERGLALADLDLGDVTMAQLGSAGATVFATEPGSVTAPLMSRVGPALFRVNAVFDAQITPYADALPELREEAARDRAARLIDDRRDGIEDLIAGGATLEDLTDRTDMQLSELVWTEDSADGLAAYTELRLAITSLEQGALPALIELDDGGLAALRLDGVTPAAPRPLSEARDAVAEAWMRAETIARSTDLATALATRVAAGDSFEALGLSPTTSADLTVASFVEGAPQDMVERAFESEIGAAIALSDNTGAFVMRLDAKGEADMAEELRASSELSIDRALVEGITNDVFQAYLDQVGARTEVTTNDAAIAAVHQSFQ